MRRVSWASTSRRSRSRDSRTARSIAGRVISWKTIRRTGTLGDSTSMRCQAIDSPSRSSSVARYSSLASLTMALSLRTWSRLSRETT